MNVAELFEDRASKALEKKVSNVLYAVEDELPHEARYKSFDVNTVEKIVDWVTQETFEMDEKKVAARTIAKALAAAGFTGWKVKVTVRDHNGTKWGTAKS